MASLDNMVATGQNVVQAINALRIQLASFFPQVTAFSTAVRGSVGTITFTSSQATGFLAVTTSSGAVVYLATYPSS